MPISIARKIEFYQRGGVLPDVDIALEPIVLTADQVTEYELPRVPVKDSDRRKANWVRDHGQGQVELDALEALHPGDLRDIVIDAIHNYYDTSLVERAQRQRRDLYAALDTSRGSVLDEYMTELDALWSSYYLITNDYDDLGEQYVEAVAPMQEQIEQMSKAMDAVIRDGTKLYDEIYRVMIERTAQEVDVGDYPQPDPNLPDEGELLYSAGRQYAEQLRVYKNYRHNGGN